MRLAALLLALCPLTAAAQVSRPGHVWQVVPDATSADLAAHGWSVVESAGLTTPEGAPIVVTFWEHPQQYGRVAIMRCLTTLDASLNPVAEVCSEPGHPEE